MSAEFEERVLNLVESNAAADVRHSRRLEKLAEDQQEFFQVLSQFIDQTRERLADLDDRLERQEKGFE